MNKFLKSIYLERGCDQKPVPTPLLVDKFEAILDAQYMPLNHQTAYNFKVDFNHTCWIDYEDSVHNNYVKDEVLRKCRQVLQHYIFGDTQAILRELLINLDLKDYDACIEILKLAMNSMEYK